MTYLKNKFSKMVIFTVVLSLLLLLIIPAGIIFGNSDKDLKEEYERALIALETAQEEVTRAQSDLESVKMIEAEARANQEAAGQKLTVSKGNYAGVSPEVEKLKEKLSFAQAAAEEANSFYERLKETGTEEEINAATNAAEKAKTELDSISAEYDAANSNLMALQKELDEAKAEFEKVKLAADEANASLLYAEKILNEKNENLTNALSEVEKTKAELEAYEAKIAEDEENTTSDEGDNNEELSNEEIGEEILEEESTEEEIIEEEVIADESIDVAATEESIIPEEEIEEEVTKEAVTEESMLESEEDDAAVVEEVKAEVIEVASELVPEDETMVEEVTVDETGEVKINISFSVDENGYVPAGHVTTFGASIEEIDPFQYFWDFGDGSSSSSQSPQYTYASDGNYTLSLTIIDIGGNAYSKSATVNVSDYNPNTTEYWISADATEDGIGTIDNPFTIDVALLHTVNGDILYFLPGTYNTSVNLDGIGTGTEGVPIETETGAEGLLAETETEDELPVETETKEEDLSIKFIAYDDVIFDGQSTLDYAFYYTSPLSYLGFYNFTFINYLGSAIYIDNEDVTNIVIVDNTFSGNDAAIDVTMDSGLNIQNNIIVDNDAGVIISAGNVNIKHNIIAFNEEGIVVDDTKDNITVDYNDVFGNGKDYQGVEIGENDISVDPEFADKDNLDFSVLEDSPLYENNIIMKSSTDKDDYTYGEKVVITGSGYKPYQELIIKILRANGTFVEDIHITADANGNFTYNGYSEDYPGTDYLIEIIDTDGNILEVLGFTDCHVTIKLCKSGFPSTGLPDGEYAGFTLYNNSGGAIGSEKKLYGNGAVIWGNLSTGTYWIKETHVPDGYEKMDDIKVNACQNIEYKVCRTNEKIKGDITLNKTGLDARIVAGFTLYNSSGSPVGSEKTVTGNGSVSWIDLEWDTYKIVETTTPAGYTPIADITVIVVDSTQQTYSFDRVNEKVLGEISLTKSGLEGTDEVTFTLSGPDSYSQSYTVSAGSPEALWSNLAQGSYTLIETPDPGNTYNYTLTVTPAGPYEIGTGAGESHTYTLGAVNTPDCDITLNKTGLDFTDVAGFTLYNSAGAAVGSERIITGNGSITWSDLLFDTYKIVETTVPAEYSKMADIEGIVIGAEEHNYTFNRVNTKITVPGSITLNKSGLNSTDTAGLTLYYPSGGAVGGEKMITGNGAVTWADLPYGTYKIVETTIPAGYSKMSDITGIEVGATQNNYSFSRTNTRTPPPPPPPPPSSSPVIEVLSIQELPFTGMNPFIPIAGISFIIAGVVLFTVSVSRRRKNIN